MYAKYGPRKRREKTSGCMIEKTKKKKRETEAEKRREKKEKGGLLLTLLKVLYGRRKSRHGIKMKMNPPRPVGINQFMAYACQAVGCAV